MRKKDVDCVVRKIKEVLSGFERKVFLANYGTFDWQEIKKIVIDVCEKKRIVYVNKDDLTKVAIQEIRTSIKKEREKQENTETTREIKTKTTKEIGKDVPSQALLFPDEPKKSPPVDPLVDQDFVREKFR